MELDGKIFRMVRMELLMRFIMIKFRDCFTLEDLSQKPEKQTLLILHGKFNTLFLIFNIILYFNSYFFVKNHFSWNGTEWFVPGQLGIGADDEVKAISQNGTDIYIGGIFFTVDGVSAKAIASKF